MKRRTGNPTMADKRPQQLQSGHKQTQIKDAYHRIRLRMKTVVKVVNLFYDQNK